MKLLKLVTLLLGAVTAAPTNMLEAGKSDEPHTDLDELKDGDCRSIIFIWARGSKEPGNMGADDDLGPATCNLLKSNYGESEVACQGIGPPYYADLFGNAYANDGTTELAYGEGINMFNLAASKCPDSNVFAGGYSQGAAVITASIRRLEDLPKRNLVGVVMYGDTRSDQEHGRIPNYSPEATLAICEPGDGVCDGDYDLDLTEAHHQYCDDVPTAVAFLEKKLENAELNERPQRCVSGYGDCPGPMSADDDGSKSS